MTDDHSAALIAIAQALVSNGKGILAADESTGTIAKRFSAISLSNTEDNRRNYRELLFSANGLEQHIGGCILFDETLRQKAFDGRMLSQVLSDKGILVGIKVDKGLIDLPTGEPVAQGIDGLNERCAEYYKLGARFAKWRSVLRVSEIEPSELAISANAQVLAHYASICQRNGLVPIVEPEILMDGNHSIERTQFVSERVLSAVYKCLNDYNVLLEGTLLKPSMVTPAVHGPSVSDAQIASCTVRALLRTVPGAVPGIVFLSGGQSEQEATARLNATNSVGCVPWRLSFSYGRALQQSVLSAWQGKGENILRAQKVLVERAAANSLASEGKLKIDASASKESSFIESYKY